MPQGVYPLCKNKKERPKKEEKQSPLAYTPLMGVLGTEPKVQGSAESQEKSSRRREPGGQEAGRPAGALAPRTVEQRWCVVTRVDEGGRRSRELMAAETARGYSKARVGRQRTRKGTRREDYSREARRRRIALAGGQGVDLIRGYRVAPML